jgi:hypothetical protein
MTPEEVLQTCLQEVEEGRKTPAECAAAFPHLPDLEAQLLAASELRTWSALSLRPAASRRIKARLQEQWRALQRPPRVVTPVRRPSSVLRWATVLGLVVTLLAASVGTAAASSRSLPGDALYPVKRTTEAIQLILTPASERASLHVTLAQRRLDEIVALTESGRLAPELLNDLASRLAAETEAALAEVENAPPTREAEILGMIIQLTDQSQLVLTSLQASAPPQAQAGLAHALEVSSQSHQNAQVHLEQGRPPTPTGDGSGRSTPIQSERGQTQVPSGQQKRTATTTAVSSRTPRAEPRDRTQASEGSDTGAGDGTSMPAQPTSVPPGQQKRTATATAVPSRTPRATQGQAGGEGGAHCNPNNPQAPNFCTPTSSPDIPPTGPLENATPTPCPLNPAGQPVCKP